MRRRTLALWILSGVIAAHAQVLTTTDVSPDQSTFAGTDPGDSDTAGRIKSLVIDPHNSAILYAAAEMSGVWKSTTGFLSAGPNSASSQLGKMKWFQSSNGLRNGLTVNQYSLAVDPSVTGINDDQTLYSKRLLYATGDDDGRPGNPDGGLWVSTDAASNWSHVSLCGPGNDDITSVIFSGGQPFVATKCGIWTTTDEALTSSWGSLTTTFTGLSGAILADGGDGTFFTCAGSLLVSLKNLGRTLYSEALLPSGSKCLALTAVPGPTSAATQVVVVRSDGAKNTQEVTVADFGVIPAAMTDLGFSSVSYMSAGSGVSAVAAVHIRSPLVPSPPLLPGLSYDLYAADGCAWFAYKPTTLPPWQRVAPGAGGQCNASTSTIHADTWAMVFPGWYDTGKGVCAAYAATDGGVFFTGTTPSSLIFGGCHSTPWGPVQTGLHALAVNAMGGITAGSLPYSPSFPLAIYVPTGDNDMFVWHLANCVNTGGVPGTCSFLPRIWQNFKKTLGDAGQALVDPLYPEQVLISRNDQNGKHYVTVDNPPLPGGTYKEIIEPTPPLPVSAIFDNGYNGPGQEDLSVVKTLLTEFPVGSLPPNSPPLTAIKGDYLAVQDDSPPLKHPTRGCDSKKHDHILRNPTGSPPDPNGWVDLSSFFHACNVMKVQAAGGHQNLTVYVLMNTADSTSDPPVSYPPGYEPGKIYKGRVDSRQPGSGLILTWFPASGSSTNPLGQADDFFVNPYDPNELYAVDVQHQRIMHSVDGGGNWLMEPTLKDIATNHGEYRIGCNGSRGGLHAPSPFSNSCSLSSMFFDPFAPNIRVAAMLYGGIAFSRDKGKDWMALDVTDNNHFLSNNLTEPVVSVIYDGETQLPDVTYSANVIYAGLMGKSLKRVEGPFQILESLNFSYQSASASKISVVIATLGQTVRLRKDSDNVFRGSALFNYSTLPLSQEVEYYFLNDGIATATYKWTVDTTSGVSNTPLAH